MVVAAGSLSRPRTALTAATLGLAVAGAAWWLAAYTPAREWPLVALLVALDKPAAVGFVALSAVIGAVAAASRSRRLVIPAALILTVGCLFGGRAVAQGAGPGDPPRNAHALRAVAWNADGVDPERVADALVSLGAGDDLDMTVLPETGWRSGELVADRLAARGADVRVFAPDYTATSVILSAALADAGGYRLDDTTPAWAGLTLRPATPTSETPVILAAHLQQPSIGNVDTWAAHLRWVADTCNSTPYVIVLGDLNTTLNHLGGDRLGACRDVATAHGAGAASTWPTWLPSWLGVAIDRFLVGGAYDVADATFRVRDDIEVYEADHRPIEVSLSVGPLARSRVNPRRGRPGMPR